VFLGRGLENQNKKEKVNIVAILIALCGTQMGSANFSVRRSEFIISNPPFASSHASTIAETADGLVAAWFGGSREGADDVGIWLSCYDGRAWTAPREVATGLEGEGTRRYPCWNPVLFGRRPGRLLLFYKVGPTPSTWWGMLKASADGGRTWDEARRLPAGIIGPVKNKPVELADGTLLCGSSSEKGGWRVHMEWTRDPFGDWRRGPDLNEPPSISAIQPTILSHRDGRYQILCRSGQGMIMEAWSAAGDATSWMPLAPTTLPNPNSGIDGITLADGRFLLVSNPTKSGRGVLDAVVSRDGKIWQLARRLENEPGAEFSYPAVIQTKDGLVHITYTWKRRRIKHVVLDPSS
jgi:predicted neuraminidase